MNSLKQWFLAIWHSLVNKRNSAGTVESQTLTKNPVLYEGLCKSFRAIGYKITIVCRRL